MQQKNHLKDIFVPSAPKIGAKVKKKPRWTKNTLYKARHVQCPYYYFEIAISVVEFGAPQFSGT